MLGQFGNNWIQKNSSENGIGWGRMSSEFFSSNHFQIGEHVVLLHTAKSKKVALVIGHMEQCNDLLEWPPDNNFPMRNSQSQYPKQPLSNQLYSFFEKGCRKNVHATIPKGNMGYGQYTVSNECSCRTYICCFPVALENMSVAPRAILSDFFEEPSALKTTHNTFRDCRVHFFRQPCSK